MICKGQRHWTLLYLPVLGRLTPLSKILMISLIKFGETCLDLSLMIILIRNQSKTREPWWPWFVLMRRLQRSEPVVDLIFTKKLYVDLTINNENEVLSSVFSCTCMPLPLLITVKRTWNYGKKTTKKTKEHLLILHSVFFSRHPC